jgi:putative oxidoreductase
VFHQEDLAKLLLRISVGVLILFHGVHKMIHGLGGVESLLLHAELPTFLAYGVYIGELIAPIFILLGLYARVASLVLALNMFMAIYLVYGFSFSLSKYGALGMESPLLFLVMALLIFLLGAGKYGVNNK